MTEQARQRQKIPATMVESISWAIVCVGLFIAVVAGVIFSESKSFDRDVSLIMVYVGGLLAGTGLLPALLLTGARQLLDRHHWQLTRR